MTRSLAVQNQKRRLKRNAGESSASATPAAPPVTTRPPANPASTVPINPPPTISIEIDVEDSGSEYETDTDAEPEEFYLSLDLTIPTPIHAGPSSNPHANVAASSDAIPPPLPLSSTTRSGRSGRRHLPARPSHSLPHHPSSSNNPNHPNPDDEASNQVARWAGGDGGRLQLLDLHTENPLISFNNRIWSGSWMGTVGTEMYILCPEGPAPEDSVEVRGVYVSQKDTSAAAAATTGATVSAGFPDMSMSGADPNVGRVIAVSGTRIHCLPAVVTAKERRFGVEDQTRTYGWRPGKSTFLERLEAIQIARGERKPRGKGDRSTSEDGESVEEGGTTFQQRMDEAGSSNEEMASDEEDAENDENHEDDEQEEHVGVQKTGGGLDAAGYFAAGWERGKTDDMADAGEGPSVLPATEK